MPFKIWLVSSFILAVMLFGSSREASATKIKVYTLPELVEKADAIVVAKMAVEGDIPRARVLRTLKGSVSSAFTVITSGVPERDKVSFSDGEVALLFTQRGTDGARRLLGYGAQGKWPKTDGRWPYSELHVAPLGKVEAAVKELLALQSLGSRVNGIGRLSEMLSANDDFTQLIALEYVQNADDAQVFQVLRPKIIALSKSDKRLLRSNAEAILEFARKNNF